MTIRVSARVRGIAVVQLLNLEKICTLYKVCNISSMKYHDNRVCECVRASVQIHVLHCQIYRKMRKIIMEFSGFLRPDRLENRELIYF